MIPLASTGDVNLGRMTLWSEYERHFAGKACKGALVAF